MPAVDDPFGVAASLPGQLAKVRQDLKDLASNNTQAATIAAAASVASANSAASAANAAAASATAASNATISPQVGSAGTNSYILSTTYATYASFNFTVPTGFTQVYINVSGSFTAISTAPGTEIGYARILINGSAGTEGRSVFPAPTTFPAVPAFGAAGIGGLVAGALIPIEIQGRLNTGPGLALPSGASVSVSGVALFFR